MRSLPGLLVRRPRTRCGRRPAAQSPQPPAASPAFEVASIKPNTSGDGRVMMQNQPGRFIATNVTLRLLIRNAYQLQDFQITGGPGWLASDHFDINAKVPDEFRDVPPGRPGEAARSTAVDAPRAARGPVQARRPQRDEGLADLRADPGAKRRQAGPRTEEIDDRLRGDVRAPDAGADAPDAAAGPARAGRADAVRHPDRHGQHGGRRLDAEAGCQQPGDVRRTCGAGSHRADRHLRHRA